MARGEKSGKAVLTDEAVRKMRKLASKGQTHHQLAALFQTSASNVGQVLSRQTWKHVK
jgi:transcriptional regulator